MNSCQQRLAANEVPLRRGRFETLQINVSHKCNQTSTHCHVDAGPHRTKMMDADSARKVGAWPEQAKLEADSKSFSMAFFKRSTPRSAC
jgi:hypothetical protein